MKNIKFPIVVTIAVLLFYAFVLPLNPYSPVIMTLFAVSPFIVLWMVYLVLKGQTVKTQAYNQTYEEYVHDNVDVSGLRKNKNWNHA